MRKRNYLKIFALALAVGTLGFGFGKADIKNTSGQPWILIPLDPGPEGVIYAGNDPESLQQAGPLAAGEPVRIPPGSMVRFQWGEAKGEANRARFQVLDWTAGAGDGTELRCAWGTEALGLATRVELVLPTAGAGSQVLASDDSFTFAVEALASLKAGGQSQPAAGLRTPAFQVLSHGDSLPNGVGAPARAEIANESFKPWTLEALEAGPAVEVRLGRTLESLGPAQRLELKRGTRLLIPAERIATLTWGQPGHAHVDLPFRLLDEGFRDLYQLRLNIGWEPGARETETAVDLVVGRSSALPRHVTPLDLGTCVGGTFTIHQDSCMDLAVRLAMGEDTPVRRTPSRPARLSPGAGLVTGSPWAPPARPDLEACLSPAPGAGAGAGALSPGSPRPGMVKDIGGPCMELANRSIHTWHLKPWVLGGPVRYAQISGDCHDGRLISVRSGTLHPRGSLCEELSLPPGTDTLISLNDLDAAEVAVFVLRRDATAGLGGVSRPQPECLWAPLIPGPVDFGFCMTEAKGGLELMAGEPLTQEIGEQDAFTLELATTLEQRELQSHRDFGTYLRRELHDDHQIVTIVDDPDETVAGEPDAVPALGPGAPKIGRLPKVSAT